MADLLLTEHGVVPLPDSASARRRSRSARSCLTAPVAVLEGAVANLASGAGVAVITPLPES